MNQEPFFSPSLGSITLGFGHMYLQIISNDVLVLYMNHNEQGITTNIER